MKTLTSLLCFFAFSSVGLAYDYKTINFTNYGNSISYALNKTKPDDPWVDITLRADKYDCTWWNLTAGKDGFFIAIGFGN